MNPRSKILLPLLALFLLLAIAIVVIGLIFPDSGVDYRVLMGANCIFFLASLVVFRMQRKAMENVNPHVFVRSVMAGVMIKMFICVIAVIIYVLLIGKAFNKPGVFIALVLYLVYLCVEVAVLMKLNKRKNA